MAISYSRIPYNNTSGIGLFYGDKVPESAVNLAYVKTGIPPVPDVITVEDDLINDQEFVGNSITATVRELELINTQLIDPLTSDPFIAQTDNVFITTVTSNFQDATGNTTPIPLFYMQELRFPISISSLSPSIQAALSDDFISTINPGSAEAIAIQQDDLKNYQQTNLDTLKSLVDIQTESGNILPTGYLWEVMPGNIDGDNLYLRLYTNFQGTFKQRFIVSWGQYEETLNVHTVFLQHPSAASDIAYLANPVLDNSVSASATGAAASGSSTTTITFSASAAAASAAQTAPVNDSSILNILSSVNYTVAGTNISTTTTNPYFQDTASGYETFPGQASYYTTGSSTVAPTTTATQLTLTFGSVNCSFDSNGISSLQVNLLDPSNNLVAQYLISTSTVVSYYNAEAIPGVYTWQIFGIVNDSPGIIAGAGAGPFNYSCSYSGSYAWFTAQGIAYTPTTATPTIWSTQSAIAPTSSINAISLQVTNLNVPSDLFGTTSYQAMIFGPSANGNFIPTNALQTWSFTTPQTLTYFNAGAIAGIYTFTVVASVTSLNTGISSYSPTLTGILKWFIQLQSVPAGYTTNVGQTVSLPTNQQTIAPISPNSQLSLDLTFITTPSDANGSSAFEIVLVDPNGNAVATYRSITAPQNLVYFNPNAVAGIYTWNLFTYCISNQRSAAVYTGTFSANLGWYVPNLSFVPNPTTNRTLGFTFNLALPNGTVYLTTDNGAQIFLQEPDNLDSDSNWYLRMHRGWLNYTDSNSNNYLVGLEPYYTQNFDGYFPLITASQRKADVISTVTIQVENTPIYVDTNYPIDIVVTRQTSQGLQNYWVTRDNLMASGVYQPQSIADIDGARGTITLADFVLFNGDTVHVSYTYSEYYYVYQGFPDKFGRFIWLDVNPSGGHTWFNIWNIQDEQNVETFTPSISSPSVSGFIGNVPLTVNRSQVVAATSTSVIVSATAAGTTNSPFSAPILGNATTSITSSASAVPTSITLPFIGSSEAQILATPTPTVVDTFMSVDSNYTGTARIVANPTSTSTVNQKSTTGTAPSTVNINTGTQSLIGAFTSSPSNKQLAVTINTISYDQPYSLDLWQHTIEPITPVSIPIRADASPNTAAAALSLNLSNCSMNIVGAGQGTVNQYPWNLYDHQHPIASEPPGILAGPYINVVVQLFNPAGVQVQSWTLSSLTAAQNLSWFSPGATVGTYTYKVTAVAVGGNTTWTSLNILSAVVPNGNSIPSANTVYEFNFTEAVSAQQTISTPYYWPTLASSGSFSTPTNTVAPLASNSQLQITVTPTSLPSDSYATVAYEAILTNPAGIIVGTTTGISSPTTITYSNPKAIAGAYVWTVNAYTTVIGTTPTKSSYNATANVSSSWYELDTVYGYNYVPTASPTTNISTGSDTLAPNSVGLQLSLAISNVILPSNTYGSSSLLVLLTGPQGELLSTTTVSGNQTIYYSSPIASPGQYNWAISTICSGGGSDSGYNGSASIVAGWYESQTITGYSYAGAAGPSVIYITSPNTVAPTSTGNQLSLTLVALNVPSDGNGNSYINLALVNSAGSQVASWNNVIATGTFTYSNAAALPGSYTWTITAQSNATSLTGTSTYNVTFSGNYTAIVNIYNTVYSNVLSASATYQTPSTTLAPVNSGLQLSLNIHNLSNPSDPYGTPGLQVKLFSPTMVLLQTTIVTSPTIVTYFNAAAAAGVYTWAISAEAVPTNTGISSYAVSYGGTYGWFKQVVTSSIVYNETDGAAANYSIPASTIAGAFTPPTSASSQLVFNIQSVSCPASAGGASSFTVQLQDHTHAILQTYSGITSPTVLSYSNVSAGSGTQYYWNVFATATNNNTAAANFPCSLSGTYYWYEVDQVPTQMYSATPGALATFTTDNFTVAPQTTANELFSEFTQLVYSPHHGAGEMYVVVNLYDPNNNLLTSQTISASGSPSLLLQPYFNQAAISGPYTFTVQAFININPLASKVGTFPVYYTLQATYQDATQNITPTNVLVQSSIYMYLTEEGYPFHAVLAPINNPETPLLYDTNNALAGTRYSAIPTIHSF